MNTFDWESWQTYVGATATYLQECPMILTAENFEEALKCLPSEYSCLNIVGSIDDSGLNRDSLLGLIRVIPIAQNYDFFITSYPWPERKHAGLFVNLCMFKNGNRLMLSFADETIFFKASERREMHYKSFATGEAFIADVADMNQVEKLLSMLED